jgi:lysophospholipase L1-like esterase
MSQRSSSRIPFLSLLALASLVVNILLLKRSHQLFRRWREVLLDPLGLHAFSMHPIAPAPPPGDRLVIFFGDSRAAAWNIPRLNGFSFANLGINGESSSQALGRISYHLAPLEPDLVILQVGVNDLWSSVYMPEQRQAITTQTLANLQQIVAGLRQIQSQVILVTIFPLGKLDHWQRLTGWQHVQEDIRAVNASLESLGGTGIYILDAATVLTGADGYIQSRYSLDALHLNDAGYAALNEALLQILAVLP